MNTRIEIKINIVWEGHSHDKAGGTSRAIVAFVGP